MAVSVIDLFCGAGGLSFGMENAGAEIIAGFDNDASALETFKKNHPSASSYNVDLAKSISNINNFKGIDLVVGGPPCQGFSISGKRDPKDIRNQLYKAYYEILKKLSPKVFILENVPNMISMDKGKFKEEVISSLGELGYNISVQVILASDYGVPQRRRRVFFFGCKDHTFELRPRSQKKGEITCKDAISDLPDLDLDNGEKYTSNSKSEYQKHMRLKSSGVWNHVLTNHSEQTKSIISLVPDGGNYKDLPTQLQNTRRVNIAWTRYSSDKPSFTIDTGHRHHFHYEFNRVPTVRESARLQSFPDHFIFLGSKTNQYRHVGNAVPPLLAQEILFQIQEMGAV